MGENNHIMDPHQIFEFLKDHPESSRSQIANGIGYEGSEYQLKKMLTNGVETNILTVSGKGSGTKYSLSNIERKYPDGIQTFEKIRTGDYVYVDKTALIYSLVNESSRSIFLSRPRRFGKSLLISTLKAYFEGKKDLFKGLAISKLESRWEKHPVVRLDLSTAGDALDADQLYQKLGSILRENEESFNLPACAELPGERLYSLVHQIYKKTGQTVVLLIDEYDAPVLGALYQERENLFRLIVKELFSPVKKLDPYLHFTFLSGITKFSQLSIFSTLNNLYDISLEDRYADLCGFTDKEIGDVFSDDLDRLAIKRDISKEEARRQIKNRYDGYHFSPQCVDIYNPFSVLRTFASMKIADYWFASGTPTVLYNTLKRFDTDLYDIDGIEVTSSVFDQPAEGVTNAVSLFYQSGYLTIRSYSKEYNTYILSIPNAEVRTGLMENLLPIVYGKNPIESQNTAIRFKRALINNDIALAIDILKGFFASIPYPEFGKDSTDALAKKESYYKRLFYVVFSFMNVQIYTELMNSEGRTDAVMYLSDKVYVVEAKLDARSAQEAIDQIDDKGYAERFLGSGRKVLKLGLNFSSKTRTIEDWILTE